MEDNKTLCGKHDKAIENLETSDTRQWEIINEIQKRPPVWATCAISLLTFLLGCSLTWAGLTMHYAKMLGDIK